MIKYATEIEFKKFEELDLFDYICATLNQRRANLDSFEEAALQVLAELDSSNL